MIKANELRKENLFFYKGQPETVDGIDENDYIIIYNNYYDDGIEHIKEEDAYPILLSAEWLERCGQKCAPGHQWEFQIQVGALKWYFRWNTEWYSEIGGIYIDSRIQFVHQLQNLYFAFTGNELPITAPDKVAPSE